MQKRNQFIHDYLRQVDGSYPNQRLPKHQKMATDPFLFFRGSSQLFYADIFEGHVVLPKAFSDVPLTTIMGDCHLSNFGFLTEEGSHGDNVIFAPNDFDDACVAPAVWDLLRFLVSIVLGAEYGQRVSTGELDSDEKLLGKPVVDGEQVGKAMAAFIDEYIEVCRASTDSAAVLSQAVEAFSDTHILSKSYNKALRRSSSGEEFTVKSSLAKAIDWSENCISFKHNTEKFQRIDKALYIEIEDAFSPYVDDHILDIVARLGAGTGSLNLSRYYLLVGPKDFQGEPDLSLCHIVEIKQQRIAAPLYHFNDLSPVNRLNPAHLTIQCQRRMQRYPDLVLDEVEWQGKYWLVRSRHHAKVGIKPENVVMGKKATQKNGYINYAKTCGHALALAHCRGDKRSNRFELKMVDALANNKNELMEASRSYAKQVQLDTLSLQELSAS